MRSLLTRLGSALLVSALLLVSPALAERVPTNTFKGKITFIRGDQTAVVNESSYVLVTVDDSTWKEGLVERGAKATVIYRVGDNLALKIFTDREAPPEEE